MSCNLRILCGFSVMIQKQFSRISALFPGGQIFLSEKHLKKLANHIRLVKRLKIWNNFGEEFASEGVEAAYIARNFFIFYSYLKSCVWLLLEAVTLPITSASCERSFSKMKIMKQFPRNSMTSERLGNVDVSGVCRVWQAWHTAWQKVKSLFTVSLTSILHPMHS